MQIIAGQLLRFCLVGGIGCVIDAGLTVLLTQALHWAPQASRVVGFLIAATVTWELNRRFTFRAARRTSSLPPYLALAAIGAAVNFGIFVVWLKIAGTTTAQLLLGIALGAAAALTLNFTISRRFIFRAR